jgi:hypothetical protein
MRAAMALLGLCCVLVCIGQRDFRVGAAQHEPQAQLMNSLGKRLSQLSLSYSASMV